MRPDFGCELRGDRSRNIFSTMRMTIKAAAAIFGAGMSLAAPRVCAAQTLAERNSYVTEQSLGFSRAAARRSSTTDATSIDKKLETSAIGVRAGTRASRWLIATQTVGGAFGAWIGALLAYKAFDNPADRRTKGDESYSPNTNTAYALGSFVGSTAAVHLIGRSDGSRAPLMGTMIGTGIVTVPLLTLRQDPYMPLIGFLFGAPLQGLFGTAGYQLSRTNDR